LARPFNLYSQLAKARLLALLLPLLLLAGALGSQYVGGLFPCEMCHWQRWPHYAAVVVALAAWMTRGTSLSKPLTIIAGLLVLLSGAIGLFHAGVEYGWWPGITRCTATAGSSGDILADIMAAPMIRCDVAPWQLFGISLAGWNALFSIVGGSAIIALCQKRPRP
jgi:disulfide bond formation protein DsbB